MGLGEPPRELAPAMVVDMAKASDGVLGPVFLQPVLLHALVRQIANGFGAIFVAFALDVRIEIPPTGLSPREMVTRLMELPRFAKDFFWHGGHRRV